MMVRALIAIFLLGFAAPSVLGINGNYDGQLVFQAITLDKPNDPDLFVVDKQSILRTTYREAGVLSHRARYKLEYAAYFVAQELRERDDLDHLGLLFFDPRHRSYKLDLMLVNRPLQDLYATIDRLNFRLAISSTRVVVGRAAVDLSKSFIF